VTRAVALLLFACGLAFAAPVPKAAPTVESVYGKVVPSEHATCELTKSGALRITVDKSQTKSKVSFADPQVSRTVEGDFQLTVRVHHPPSGGVRVGGVKEGIATVVAGVCVAAADDPKSRFWLTQTHIDTGGELSPKDQWVTHRGLSVSSSKLGSGTNWVSPKLHDQPLYLRVRRAGNEFRFETSGDAKEWYSFTAQKPKAFDTKVVIGFLAQHNTDADAAAEFDQLDLQPLKKDEKK